MTGDRHKGHRRTSRLRRAASRLTSAVTATPTTNPTAPATTHTTTTAHTEAWLSSAIDKELTACPQEIAGAIRETALSWDSLWS